LKGLLYSLDIGATFFYFGFVVTLAFLLSISVGIESSLNISGDRDVMFGKLFFRC
jgi:hypothetical protein